MLNKLKKGQFLEVILRSSRTVFSTKDIALLWGEDRASKVTGRVNKYVTSAKLFRICRGLYAKDAQYNRFELATRIYTPAYISFETVLTRAGINFQYYETIFVATYITREIIVDGQRISFIRMKDHILNNTLGIDHSQGYSQASKERAFLDRIYKSPDYHFDHLDVLDWDQIFQILPMYQNQRMNKQVQKYFMHYKSIQQ